MQLTDIFIKRPVLATVVSLVILLLGLRAGQELSVREYPVLQNAQVNVQVFYPGADPELMEGFVTTPLEREVATADGIDFLSSTTTKGSTLISAFLRPDRAPDEALTEISSKVNKLRSRLPAGAEDPIIEVIDAEQTRPMYMSFWSDTLDTGQLSDYLSRVVEPELATIDGVQRAEFYGQRIFAIRVWLKSDRLAAHRITASEVQESLRQQNFLSALGETNGSFIKISLTARTEIRSPEAFRELVIKSDQSGVVRLGDVANVSLGAESYDGSAFWNGDPAVFMAIKLRPDANVLDTIDRVWDVWPGIISRLPEGIKGEIGYDATRYVRAAIDEVRTTLIEAVIIVVIVIFLFLGSVRSALIPAVTVPLSLVGALFVMFVFGYSINLLTLLAMVLAIGMVVDDAIIVLENIHRHVEEGMKPFDAAIRGARELVGPVIAMTITLVAVYAPIGFLTGLTGTLFTEFAFTLAGAVVISGVVALTLTPMMCSRIIKPTHGEGAQPNKLADWLDARFEKLRQAYKRRLHGALNTHHVIGVFGLIVLVSCYFLFRALPSELVPAEDPGFFGVFIESDNYATREYTEQYLKEVHKIVDKTADVEDYFSFIGGFTPGSNAGFVGLMATPWDVRERPTSAIVQDVTAATAGNSGLQIQVFQPPALPTPGRGLPVEVVLKSTRSPLEMADLGNELIARAMASKKFIFMAPELRINLPNSVVEIDRDKAAMMGIDMARIGADLSAALSGAEINRFSFDSRSYKVIQQVSRDERLNPQQLENYYTRARDGSLVPLSTVVKIREQVTPRSRIHAQQLNAAPVFGAQRPGVTLGEALAELEKIAADLLPTDVTLDYMGASRQFKQEGAALMLTFAFALIVIYLVLAAQFESFTDPLIMLVSVPMSICGALLFLNIFGITNQPGYLPLIGPIPQLTNFPGMTLNLYTQVGLLTLVGVITKHGILIVEFANKLQTAGAGKREAIEEAASIRLRPVLMTTAALVVAMIPLLTGSGPGASARFCMGLVIAGGMTIGTLFTLYVVPAMYLYLGRDYAALAVAKTVVKPARA
ncbi:MAG: efflux RND transporter permease subunit [Panacagrimonas sp.]